MYVYYCMARKRLNRIKIVLAEQDRSSSWLAEQVGKNKSTVSRWCSNSIQPTVEGLFEIAEALDVDVRVLLVSTKSEGPRY
ncbi:MAG: helix-turn-helix transcriptional regulator [Saprospiraceae bacterium]